MGMTNRDRYQLARFTTPEDADQPMAAVFLVGVVLGLTLVIIAAVAVFG